MIALTGAVPAQPAVPLLAVMSALADLASGVGPAAALAGLSAATGLPMRLCCGEEVWTAGIPAAADDSGGPEWHGLARGGADGREGAIYAAAPIGPLPDGMAAALTLFLRAVAGERVRSEALAAAEIRVTRRDELLRGLFDLSPVGVILIDPVTLRVGEANAAFLGFGYWPREAVIGHALDCLGGAGQVLREAGAIEILERTGRFGPVEADFRRPDGSAFPAILRGLRLLPGGSRSVIWLMVEDVSAERARTAELTAMRDEALRAREELHTAVQAIPHGFVLFDADDRVSMVNDQMSRVYPELAPFMRPGRFYADILRDGVAHGIFPEAVGREEEFIAFTLAAREQPEFECDTELQGGRQIRVLERATPAGGRVGLRIDMTAERESRQRLASVVEGSQAGTWECDFETGMNRVNDRWAAMLGWTLAELEPVTLATWAALIHPEDLASAQSAQVAMRDHPGGVYDRVFRLRHRDGHWVWVQSRGRVSALGPDGRPLRMAGVHVDVSALKAAEERLEQIIEAARAGTWYHDLRAGTVSINRQMADMLGHPAGGSGIHDAAAWGALIHPEDRARLVRLMSERFARGERRFQDEFRMRHRDGHWVWFLSRGQVTRWNEAGEPVATSGVHLDIGTLKRLEQDLEGERDFLAKLMETSVSGIMAVDGDGRIVFFNREVQNIFELPSDALIDRRCDPVQLRLTDVDGGGIAFDDMPCQRVLASGRTLRDVRLRVGMPDGRVKVVSVNAAVLPDPVMSARVVCTITDITAAARAEDVLRAAIDRAEAANRAKSQFLANMSHELRTPLSGVIGMADLMAGEDLAQPQRGMVETIRESGAHLLSIVNDILDLAKVESGKLRLDPAPTAIAGLARRVEASHALAARAKGLRLRVEPAAGQGLAAARLCDAERVLQILHNLVGNAVKFTETGEVALVIRDQIPPAEGVVITVTDTGIGMTEGQSAVVFEEFTQADGSISRRFGGTGLGLPIVRRLVRLMGGRIELVSAPGRGTTVTVQLPLPLCAVPGAEAPGPGLPEAVPRFDGLRVLLADDNGTNRMILKAMLVRLGAVVTLACDGEEAIALWSPGAFDAVLLDISMPGRDGVATLHEIRDRARAAQAPLPPMLAVTANATPQYLQEYQAAGFGAALAKPATLADLARALAGIGAVAAKRCTGAGRAAAEAKSGAELAGGIAGPPAE